jgi:hypothetical protein
VIRDLNDSSLYVQAARALNSYPIPGVLGVLDSFEGILDLPPPDPFCEMGFPVNCSFEDPLMRQWLTDEAWEDAWEFASLDDDSLKEKKPPPSSPVLFACEGGNGDDGDSSGGNDSSGSASGDGNGNGGRGRNPSGNEANGHGGNAPPDRRDQGGCGGSCSISYSGYSTFNAGYVKTYRACAKSSSQTSRSLLCHAYDLRKPADSSALLSANPSGLPEQGQLAQYWALAFLGWFSLLYDPLSTYEAMYHHTSPFDDRDLVRQVVEVY